MSITSKGEIAFKAGYGHVAADGHTGYFLTAFMPDPNSGTPPEMMPVVMFSNAPIVWNEFEKYFHSALTDGPSKQTRVFGTTSCQGGDMSFQIDRKSKSTSISGLRKRFKIFANTYSARISGVELAPLARVGNDQVSVQARKAGMGMKANPMAQQQLDKSATIDWETIEEPDGDHYLQGFKLMKLPDGIMFNKMAGRGSYNSGQYAKLIDALNTWAKLYHNKELVSEQLIHAADILEVIETSAKEWLVSNKSWASKTKGSSFQKAQMVRAVLNTAHQYRHHIDDRFADALLDEGWAAFDDGDKVAMEHARKVKANLDQEYDELVDNGVLSEAHLPLLERKQRLEVFFLTEKLTNTYEQFSLNGNIKQSVGQVAGLTQSISDQIDAIGDVTREGKVAVAEVGKALRDMLTLYSDPMKAARIGMDLLSNMMDSALSLVIRLRKYEEPALANQIVQLVAQFALTTSNQNIASMVKHSPNNWHGVLAQKSVGGAGGEIARFLQEATQVETDGLLARYVPSQFTQQLGIDFGLHKGMQTLRTSDQRLKKFAGLFGHDPNRMGYGEWNTHLPVPRPSELSISDFIGLYSFVVDDEDGAIPSPFVEVYKGDEEELEGDADLAQEKATAYYNACVAAIYKLANRALPGLVGVLNKMPVTILEVARANFAQARKIAGANQPNPKDGFGDTYTYSAIVHSIVGNWLQGCLRKLVSADESSAVGVIIGLLARHAARGTTPSDEADYLTPFDALAGKYGKVLRNKLKEVISRKPQEHQLMVSGDQAGARHQRYGALDQAITQAIRQRAGNVLGDYEQLVKSHGRFNDKANKAKYKQTGAMLKRLDQWKIKGVPKGESWDEMQYGPRNEWDINASALQQIHTTQMFKSAKGLIDASLVAIGLISQSIEQFVRQNRDMYDARAAVLSHVFHHRLLVQKLQEPVLKGLQFMSDINDVLPVHEIQFTKLRGTAGNFFPNAQ